MDEQTRSIIQQLVDMHKSLWTDVVNLRAYACINNMILLRLVANTDLLKGLTPDEIELLSRTIESSRSMARHVANTDALDSYIELIEHQLGETAAGPSL